MDKNLIKLSAEALGFKVLFDEPMKDHTSFQIGGPADVFVEVTDLEQLPQFIKLLQDKDIPFFVIGKGTNLLISDKGLSGVVLVIADEKIAINGNEITCAAGARLSKLCLEAKNQSLSGLEFACGIPGTVGGAVYMNAGAYGGEIKDVIVSCTSLSKDGKVIVRSSDELELGYRTSVFKQSDEIILSATFKLEIQDKERIRLKMEELLAKRKQKQPLEFPSAGSTFKRPQGYFAAALIEQCGLKGVSVGDAEVSTKHSGFVINRGNATCCDVLELIDVIKKEVYQKTGVELETEVIFKGR